MRRSALHASHGRPTELLHRRSAVLLIAGAAVAALVASVVGLGIGSHYVDPATVVRAIVAYDPLENDHLIVVASRVPRILLGLIVGASLGLAGALMQALTRNPLADPGILGVNAGAAAAVVVAIAYLGMTSISQYVWFAFIGAAVAAVAVYLLGTAHRSAATPLRIALAGTAVTIALTALTQMVLISHETVFALFRYWNVGSLQGRGLDVISAVTPLLAVGVACAFVLARPLDTLLLGDDAARSLGTHVGMTRGATAIAVVLLAGGATAAAGPIAFVGLAAAHIVRSVAGSDHRWLVPGSMLVGASALVTADAVGRALVAPSELPTGLAAALFGAPVFVALVCSRKRGAL